MDSSSDLYYVELDRRIARKFPDRWAKQQNVTSGSSSQDKMPPPADWSAAQAFGRALNLTSGSSTSENPTTSKTICSTLGTPGQVIHGYKNVNARGNRGKQLTSCNPEAAGAHNRESKGVGSSKPALGNMNCPNSFHEATKAPSSRLVDSPPMEQTIKTMQTFHSGSCSATVLTMSNDSFDNAFQKKASDPEEPSCQPASPQVLSDRLATLNPFNLHSLNQPSTHSPCKQNSRDRKNATANRPSNELSRASAAVLSSPSPFSYEDMQREYLRQRAMVLNELRQAKEQAELDRVRIMQKMGKMLGASRWRR
jgi:hypothetical protein